MGSEFPNWLLFSDYICDCFRVVKSKKNGENVLSGISLKTSDGNYEGQLSVEKKGIIILTKAFLKR